MDDPPKLDPPSDVAGFAIPEVAPPKPENNALQQVSQMVTSPTDRTYSHGAAAPSFFSVAGAAAAAVVVVPVGWPPREKVDGVAVEKKNHVKMGGKSTLTIYSTYPLFSHHLCSRRHLYYQRVHPQLQRLKLQKDREENN